MRDLRAVFESFSPEIDIPLVSMSDARGQPVQLLDPDFVAIHQPDQRGDLVSEFSVLNLQRVVLAFDDGYVSDQSFDDFLAAD